VTRILSIAFAVVAAVVLSGCKSEGESAMSDMVDKQKEIVGILKGIKDKDSAAAAKPKLDKLGKELEAVADRMRKIKLDSTEETKLREKYESQLKQGMQDMMNEMVRIAQIPGAGEQLGGPLASPFGSGFGGGMKGIGNK
jgi:hypothetical protein